MSREDAEAGQAAYRAKQGSTQSGVRKAYAGLGDDTTFSRFVKIPGVARHRKAPNGQLWLLNMKHRVLELGRSIFYRKGVKPVSAVKRVLVSGHSNVKIGRDVRKGKLFRDYWIYTLTLEERATCPRSCGHWESCYGNNMPWAKRIEHGKPLLRALENEIRDLLFTKWGRPRPRVGILIRLHALGDFWSPEYVAFWDGMLKLHPRLAVFGYTARRLDDPIGYAIARVKYRHGRRFAIRYSDGGFDDDCTVSIREEDECPPDAFICPEQTGKTRGCGTCGLCWNSTRNVAFLEH
jgi:hypothetical protein